MAQPSVFNRKQEIQKINKDYSHIYRYLRGFALVGFGTWIGTVFFSDTDGYATNIFTEFIGIIATYFIFDEITKRSAKNELREQLYSDLQSLSNHAVLNALHRLREKRWLDEDYFIAKNLQRANWEGAYIGGLNFEDAHLEDANFQQVTNYDGEDHQNINFKKAHLWGANLEGAHLWGANLEGAHLHFANLEGAHLWGANLEVAYLWEANLESAHLRNANLEGANLEWANLVDANLEWANLVGAKLRNANLEGATLQDVTLPDGKYWTPEEDMQRFTNSEHSDYPTTLEKINTMRIDLGYKPSIN